MKPTVRTACVLVAVAGAACSRTDAGVAAWRDGDFAAAHRAFAEAADTAGDGASPELLYDRALAALQTGRLTEAEDAADAAAARGGSEFVALRDFLRGNTAFARCDIAEAQAGRAEAEPFALDVAIAHAESARRSWIAAATSRRDWPEARRNVERALLRLDALRRRRESEDSSKPKKEPSAPPLPSPPSPTRDGPKPPPAEDPRNPSRDSPKDAADDTPSDVSTAELSREDVLRLFEKLAAKEEERAAIRRARRRDRAAEVERDW